jgi:hypothetical protein
MDICSDSLNAYTRGPCLLESLDQVKLKDFQRLVERLRARLIF